MHRHPLASACLSCVLLLGAVRAGIASEGAIDPTELAALRDQVEARSEAMEHLSWLADVYGPRLTGTPAIEAAGAWVAERLREWGIDEVRVERFPFGRGWSVDRFSLHLLEPQTQPLLAYPRSWSPGTGGPVTDEERESAREQARLRSLLPEFWEHEGVVAVLDRGRDSDIAAGGSDLSWRTQRVDGGTIFPGSAGSHEPDGARGVPAATLAVEHYNRLIRVLDKGLPVKVEIDLQTRFHPETGDGNGFNLIAELPGTDLAEQVVMIGAHLDSTHAGTGATDDAAGVAAMMEVMRAFAATGIRPRRTVRLALWGGEEQGLLGSNAWVQRHLLGADGKPQPGHDDLSAYFNIDNGAGRIRGIWLQGNEAARSLLREWLGLVADLDATTIGARSVGGTDHLPFDRAGIPAFQFMQDRLEYNSRTHHSNMDQYDRVPAEDLVQTATVATVMTYAAAMADEPLPRR